MCLRASSWMLWAERNLKWAWTSDIGRVGAIITAAKGHWRPLFIVAAFTGLRASELRGLTWANGDLSANELHVTQRADRFNTIGAPKSAKSQAARLNCRSETAYASSNAQFPH